MLVSRLIFILVIVLFLWVVRVSCWIWLCLWWVVMIDLVCVLVFL